MDPKYKSIIEIGVLLGTAVVMAVAVSVGINFLLGSPKHPTVAVTTTSMLPIYNGFEDSSIHPFRGDILLVKKVPIESIDLGDVIIFDTPSISDPVVHRVVAKWFQDGMYSFRTNGDNNHNPDGWVVSGDNIHGVVVMRIPHVGWFLLVVQTTVGRLIILLLAVLVLFIGGDSEEEEKEEEERDESISSSEENTNLNNHKNFQTKVSSIGNRIVRLVQERSNVYIVLGLIIIALFLGSNLLSAVISSPSVKLYSLSDELRTQNLLESPSETPYSLSLPAIQRDKYYWYQTSNSTEETFFFPIQIEISSGGLFNNLDRIEIYTDETHANGTKGLYRWTIVYNFFDTRIFEGGIVLFVASEGPYTVMISLTVYSRGLLKSSPKSFNFPLLLSALH